jgi:hypothetical protein
MLYDIPFNRNISHTTDPIIEIFQLLPLQQIRIFAYTLSILKQTTAWSKLIHKQIIPDQHNESIALSGLVTGIAASFLPHIRPLSRLSRCHPRHIRGDHPGVQLLHLGDKGLLFHQEICRDDGHQSGRCWILCAIAVAVRIIIGVEI